MTSRRLGGPLVLVTVAALTTACAGLASSTAPLSFRIDNLQCAPSSAASTVGNVCTFLAYYGNVSSSPEQVDPSTTVVADHQGRSYTPVAVGQSGSAFLLKPGRQQGIDWTVTLPANDAPASVAWNGSKVTVRLPAPGTVTPSVTASSAPSASVTPSSTPPTTPSPKSTPTPTPTPTKTKPVVKLTKAQPTKAKPTKTTVAPTSTAPAPISAAPAPTTTRPTIRHTVRPVPPPPTNPTNPGGGSVGIG